MINNNKILTVSYGTFSCTLEGFEDSFGTMKAIAEYFRDLADGDRYFGAEPPQPDAEMLARIAEKDISRRVAAREKDGQIVLSALPAVDADATTAVPDADVAAAPVAKVAAPVADIPVARAAEVVLETPQDDTLEDLEPIETDQVDTASVLQAVEEAEVDDAFGEDAVDFAEEPAAELEVLTSVSDVLDAEARALEEEDMPDIVPGQPDADVQAFFEAEDEAEEAAHASDEAPAVLDDLQPPGGPAPDSIAAKLQRIRAVVSQQSEAEPEADYSEDEHAEPSDADPVEVARADIEEALAADDASDDEDIAATEEHGGQEDELSALLNRVQSRTPASHDLQEETAVQDADTSAEDSVSNLFEEQNAAAPEAAEAPATPLRKTPRARVIKVKRADLEAAIEQGDLEEVDEAAEAEAPARPLDDLAPAKQAKTALSPEDEADLARELAELKEDINAGRDAAPEIVAQAEEPAAARAQLPDIDVESNTDVNRLLAETANQMQEPETANRRDAFAHLRAAVAARKADATIDADEALRKGDNAYREDLAEVVRPRRPVSGEARTERPDNAGAAPLKLVAEQRVDVESDKPAAPVSPRRVAAAPVEQPNASDSDSFAEFAEEVGAHSLSDKLEAAAAYLSFVEGREQFSRPQLMTKVRQAGGEGEFSREEGLRSFGQLLRNGKIEKIKGGRFTVSEDIGFRPDQRAAG